MSIDLENSSPVTAPLNDVFEPRAAKSPVTEIAESAQYLQTNLAAVMQFWTSAMTAAFQINTMLWAIWTPAKRLLQTTPRSAAYRR